MTVRFQAIGAALCLFRLSAGIFLFGGSAGAFLFSGSAAWGESYDHCLEETNRHPEAAYDEAAVWLDEGGGLPARHCLALALVRIGQFRAGADKLKQLAEAKIDMPKDTRAELWIQAGEADLLDKAPDGALRDFDEAVKWSSEDAGLLVDRARAHVMKRDWNAAARALDRALLLDQKLPDAWCLRATARRELGKLGQAEDDIGRALALDDNRAESWLERGRLSAAKGDKAAARRAFIRAVLIDDKAPVAEDARYALEAMDLKP